MSCLTLSCAIRRVQTRREDRNTSTCPTLGNVSCLTLNGAIRRVLIIRFAPSTICGAKLYMSILAPPPRVTRECPEATTYIIIARARGAYHL